MARDRRLGQSAKVCAGRGARTNANFLAASDFSSLTRGRRLGGPMSRPTGHSAETIFLCWSRFLFAKKSDHDAEEGARKQQEEAGRFRRGYGRRRR